MMRVVEMYLIVAVTLMKTALGLPKSCLHYCKLPPENSSISPGCDCSLHNVRKTKTTSKHFATVSEMKDVGVNDDPVKIFTQNKSVDEQTLHMLSINPIVMSKQNTFKSTKNNLVTAADPFAEQENYNENISTSSKQYKRSENYLPKLIDEPKELPLHLYLDIDTTSENENSPQLEELKNMFENFHAAEKNLSECINLHIYIFSKYIDTVNKTNTNLGQKGQHDNLSNFQQLTEIESKCAQPASIIKRSIVQIKHVLSREDRTTENTLDDQDMVRTTDSYEDIKTQHATTETNDVYLSAVSTRPTDGNNNNDVTETANILAKGTVNKIFNKNYSERDGHNLVNNNVLDMTNTDLNSTSNKDSTVYDKVNLAVTTDPTDFEDLQSKNNKNRTIISENDIKLPRIITKELSNGSLVSVVDGYEEGLYSDFILTNEDHITASTPSKDSAIHNTDLLKSSVDKVVSSDIVNIRGNLFFLFGENQIPARFIQQSDGELDVAIDGFSICNQMLEHNMSNFMNSFCKCITST